MARQKQRRQAQLVFRARSLFQNCRSENDREHCEGEEHEPDDQKRRSSIGDRFARSDRRCAVAKFVCHVSIFAGGSGLPTTSA